MKGPKRHYLSVYNNVWCPWCFVWSRTRADPRWRPLSSLLWEEFPVFFLVIEKQRYKNVNLHHVPQKGTFITSSPMKALSASRCHTN